MISFSFWLFIGLKSTYAHIYYGQPLVKMLQPQKAENRYNKKCWIIQFRNWTVKTANGSTIIKNRACISLLTYLEYWKLFQGGISNHSLS